MAEFNPISALAPVYKKGKFGTYNAKPLMLEEVRGQSIYQISAWPSTIEEVQKTITQFYELKSFPDVGESALLNRFKLIWQGPNQYWIVASNPQVAIDLQRIISRKNASIFDLSQARTIIRVTGDYANQMLNKGLPVNLEQNNEVGRVYMSSFANHFPALVNRIAPSSYDIYVFRSYGRSFWEWLTDASLEFGYEVNN